MVRDGPRAAAAGVDGPPDATGRARVKLTWAPTGAQRRFRVYACDEQRFVHQARRSPAATPRTAHSGGARGSDRRAGRAQALRDHHDLFDREWFQNLTDDPLEATVARCPISTS